MYTPPPQRQPPPPDRTRPLMFALVVIVLLVSMFALSITAPRGAIPSDPLVVQPVSRDALQIVEGQLVYVPAYAEIFFNSINATRALTTTLAIHNTDLEHSIVINSVRYYDTEGTLVQEYIDEPMRVGPMATFGFVVDSADQRGGWGANFLVEWVAEQPVYEPVIEAVMVSAQGVEGISFISPGRIISQTP